MTFANIRSLAFAALAGLCVILSGCGDSDSNPRGVASVSKGSQQQTSAPAPDNSNIQVPFESITQAAPGEAKELKGAGATFPQALYKAWFNAYNNTIGVKTGYEGVGSGSGIKAIANREVDFGASDAPMSEEQMASAKGGEVIHIPTALGAIVPTYNIPGVSRKLKFTGDNIAKIYLGEITMWNDPRLVADNPHLANINQRIVVVFRKDGSGTTYGFTDYLSTVNPAFHDRIGKGTSVNWPLGIGAEGNGGVAKEIRANPYSFGYVELSFAITDQLAYGMVKNRAGKFIDPTLETVTAAAASIDAPADLRFALVNAPGERAYPICTATWLIVYKNQTDSAKALALTRLLWWATHEAQTINNTLNYAPVPKEITVRSEQLIKSIVVDGRPVFK